VWQEWKSLPESAYPEDANEIMKWFIQNMDPKMGIGAQERLAKSVIDALKVERELRLQPNFLGEGI
jgi:hypothetical protein